MMIYKLTEAQKDRLKKHRRHSIGMMVLNFVVGVYDSSVVIRDGLGSVISNYEAFLDIILIVFAIYFFNAFRRWRRDAGICRRLLVQDQTLEA